MVYVDGQLHKLPSNLKSIFTPQPPFSKPLILAGIKEILTPQKQIQDESIFDFVARRFGPDVAQYAIDPMVRGICAGDAKSISAKSFVAGPMFNLEQNYGSVFRGMLKRKLKGESPKIVPSKSVSVPTSFGYDPLRFFTNMYFRSVKLLSSHFWQTAEKQCLLLCNCFHIY